MERWHLVMLFGGLVILTGSHVQLYGWFANILECSSIYPVISLIAAPAAITTIVSLFCFATIATDASPQMCRYLGLFTVPVVIVYDLIVGMLFLASDSCSKGMGIGLLIIAMGYFVLWHLFYFLGIGEDNQLEYEVYEDHLCSEKLRLERKLGDASESASAKV